MSRVPTIPEGYELVRTIRSSHVESDFTARHKADDALVRIRMFNLGRTSGNTTRRQLREYLRADVSFIEELEQPGILKLFDYSDTKDVFWVATQPADAHQQLRNYLSGQVAGNAIGEDTAEVILKACEVSPDDRWAGVIAFAGALEGTLAKGPSLDSVSSDSMKTMAVTEPAESDGMASMPPERIKDTADLQLAPPSEPMEGITPLDPSHEIWNGRYEIIEKIGEGGQAIVYKAYDHLTNEEIAIKTIWSRHRGDRGAINRLKQGAMVARSLTHRHIIKTYSVEQRMDAAGLDRYVFICMELISGRLELADVIERRKAMEKKTGVDARADVYSVGVILYQLLTGDIPRKGSLSANKVNKEVSSSLARVIDKAISSDRDKRLKTAAA